MASYFSAQDEPPDEGDGAVAGGGVSEQDAFLPYRVELWDTSESAVEAVVAMAQNRTVGFAAYFAAAKQFPRRLIVLRDQFGELSRWDPRTH